MDREEYDQKLEEYMKQGLSQMDAAFQITKEINEEANKKYHEVAGLWIVEETEKVAFKSDSRGLKEKVKIPKGAVLIAFPNEYKTEDNNQPDYRLCWTWN